MLELLKKINNCMFSPPEQAIKFLERMEEQVVDSDLDDDSKIELLKIIDNYRQFKLRG